MNTNNPALLLEYFRVVRDPRLERNKEHNLLDIIGLTLCAVISGADTFVAIAEYGRTKVDWLKTFLSLPNGIPSHDTIGRVFALLDPEEFQRGFVAWVKAVSKLTHGEVVAIDGKTARRAYEKSGHPLHVVSAFATANGITLGQRATDKKSNEITAIPRLLQTLQLHGCIVTIDAMGCQKKSAKTVLEQGANYVLAVKGNQPTITDDLRYLFSDDHIDQYAGDYFESSEKSFGREETRRCRTLNDPRLLPDDNCRRYDWPGLRCLVEVTSERTINSHTSTETRYYLSSLSGKASEILAAVRSHWRIENSLHWSLDVAFREDESRVRHGHAQNNLNLIRKLALALLQRDRKSKVGVATKRLKAAWDNGYLCQVLRENKKHN